MKVAPLEFEKPLIEMEKTLEELRQRSQESDVDVKQEIVRMENKIRETRQDLYSNLTPWQRVQIARHTQRPYFLDYVERLTTNFVELCGDRLYANDNAIVGGFATFEGEPVMIIGQQKGRDLKENIRRNFGCPNPEGYRKALRLMRLAEKFKLPVLTFIDTPGAYPGMGGEERHVAEAIAVNLREMFTFRVPIIATVLGEGGSGGALGIGVADRVLIMENGYYSVISPEGCAAILWKDRAFAPKAAEMLRISAGDLKEFGFVDEIVPEPEGGAHHNHDESAEKLRKHLRKHLEQCLDLSVRELLAKRYRRYRGYGRFRLSHRMSA